MLILLVVAFVKGAPAPELQFLIPCAGAKILANYWPHLMTSEKCFVKQLPTRKALITLRIMHLQVSNVSIYTVYTDRFGVSESFGLPQQATAAPSPSILTLQSHAAIMTLNVFICFYDNQDSKCLKFQERKLWPDSLQNLADFAGNLSDVNKSITSTFSRLSCKKEKPGQNKLRFGISMKSIHPACAVRESRLALVTIGEIS